MIMSKPGKKIIEQNDLLSLNGTSYREATIRKVGAGEMKFTGRLDWIKV